MLVLSDVFAFVTAGCLAVLFASACNDMDVHNWLATQDVQRYGAWSLVVTCVMLLFLVRYKHYSDRKPFWTELGEIMHVISLMAMLDLAVLALTRWNASRMWWAFAWPLAAFSLVALRGSARSMMLRFRVWQRPTLIVGNGPNAQEAWAALKSEPALGFDVVGFVDSSSFGQVQVAELTRWAKVPGVQFVLAVEHGQNDVREDVLRFLAQAQVDDVCVIPAMRGVPLYGTDISYFFSHEVALLKLRNNLRYWPAKLIKRLFDVSASMVLLVVLALPMCWLALRIKQDGGAAVFAHERIGKGGRKFRCFKFRTMHMDAEQKLRVLLAQDPALRDEWDKEFKLRNDPRVTLIGKFLRRTSLDELPQLFNVIRGDMSLVGPRPIVAAELPRYGSDVDYFLMVRPGVTGLWQVSGRNDTSYDARVYLDVWYVKNWSLWYDVAILFKTIKVVLGRKGAY